MGAFGPFVTVLRILKPPQQLGWPEPFPGQHFPHPPVDLRSFLFSSSSGDCQLLGRVSYKLYLHFTAQHVG